MSDHQHMATSAASTGHLPYDRSPSRALAEMLAADRSAWRSRYAAEGDAELRAQALLERAEAALGAAGVPPTIRVLWIALADRAGRSEDADMRAAAALAGMAMGLRTS